MWALLISLFVASVVCAFKLVHTFTDWADRLGAAHITAVAGLSIAFFISALVPVDVANAGGCSLPLTGAPVPASERDEALARAADLRSVLSVSWVCLFAYFFAALPFAYSWSEASLMTPRPTAPRALAQAVGFTAIFMLLGAMLGVLGSASGMLPEAIAREPWAQQLLAEEGTAGGAVLDALLAACVWLGQATLCTYGAVGVSRLPSLLLLGGGGSGSGGGGGGGGGYESRAIAPAPSYSSHSTPQGDPRDPMSYQVRLTTASTIPKPRTSSHNNPATSPSARPAFRSAAPAG